MKKNPSITELNQSDKFELIAELSHSEVKEFVIEQIQEEKKLVRVYIIYQSAMILLGLFFFIRAGVLAFKADSAYMGYTVVAIVFSFSLLIVIHELLHGIALKLTGAPKVNYGGDLKKFIFFAEADQHVMNRQQFYFIALTPLIVIKIISGIGIIVSFSHPAVYFFILLMCLHSLFCAGDIGLIAFFNLHKNSEVYTYDIREEKRSYFYKRRQKN